MKLKGIDGNTLILTSNDWQSLSDISIESNIIVNCFENGRRQFKSLPIKTLDHFIYKGNVDKHFLDNKDEITTFVLTKGIEFSNQNPRTVLSPYTVVKKEQEFYFGEMINLSFRLPCEIFLISEKSHPYFTLSI